MTRPQMLREQAALIRALAKIIDIPEVRVQLLDAANKCEHYASAMEEAPQE